MNQANLFKKSLVKPDGRYLHLFSAKGPIAEAIVATSPSSEKTTHQSHLRWHPLLGQWVAYASHRQNRTFLPPKEFNPLAPTRPGGIPTELPSGDYEVAVFENLFASLNLNAVVAPDAIVPTYPGKGVCEVVVFTQNPDLSLGRLSLGHIETLLRVWADRYHEIQKHSDIKYVLPFENRGVEMGVTLHHPHGQIYSYPFIPPVPLQMYNTQIEFWKQKHKTLLSDLMEKELGEGSRVVSKNSTVMSFVPACARYPYEVWVAPLRPVSSLTEFTDQEFADFAEMLKTVILKYDHLWNRPFPYLMSLYAAPNDQEIHPEWHFHVQFYPAYRSKDKLKFLAGTELAAGMFVNDSLPEEKAAELRAVDITNLKSPTAEGMVEL